jgi:phasin family protein
MHANRFDTYLNLYIQSEAIMYPFPQAVSPAIRTHVDAQTAYLNDISKSMFRAFQQMIDLNIQLTQTMLEETALTGKQVMSADRHSELMSAATSRAQPASEKLRAYQLHIARLAADAQVELARVTEHHGQTTARTARALADEVARDATEQTERGLRAQQETVRQFSDPFVRADGGSQSQAGMHAPSGSGLGNGEGTPQYSSQPQSSSQPQNQSSAASGDKQPATGSRTAAAH